MTDSWCHIEVSLEKVNSKVEQVIKEWRIVGVILKFHWKRSIRR